MNLVVQNKILHCGQRDMSSWSMVNNEQNWLPWQIKDWFKKIKKKSPKGAQSLGLVKYQVPSPQRVKGQFTKTWYVTFGDNQFMPKHTLHILYKLLQYTCLRWTYYTCSYVKRVWDMSQYHKVYNLSEWATKW